MPRRVAARQAVMLGPPPQGPWKGASTPRRTHREKRTLLERQAARPDWVIFARFNERRASNDFRWSPNSRRAVAQVRSVAKDQEQRLPSRAAEFHKRGRQRSIGTALHRPIAESSSA